MTSLPERLQAAITRRAEREGLWDMPFRDVDLETMAEEVVEDVFARGLFLGVVEANLVVSALAQAEGSLIAMRAFGGDGLDGDGLGQILSQVEAASKMLRGLAVQSTTVPEFARGLGAFVGGIRNTDGTWTCDCGEIVNTDLDLYMHRRHDPAHKAVKV
jgi:hypothetical protein